MLLALMQGSLITVATACLVSGARSTGGIRGVRMVRWCFV